MTVPRKGDQDGSRRGTRKFNRDVDRGKRTNDDDDKFRTRPATKPDRENRRWEHGPGGRTEDT